MNKAEFLKFYSSKKWECFPCRPNDKTPLVKWADVATTEINMLNGWLEQWPDMNIGIATGKRSGIFVLDVDAGHGGEESLSALLREYGELPQTPIAMTGGGGRHFIFQHPGFPIGNVQNSGKIGKGIDVRGDGGYIVVAPSLHPNGNHYVWDKEHAPSMTPVAPAPEWLLKKLIQPVVVEQQPERDNSAIPNGGRNNTLISLAGAMKRRGMGEDAIYQALLIENKQKCIPPLADHEVKMISQSIMRYESAVKFEQSRDRLQTEWSFCKSMFEFPENIGDFQDVFPQMFQDHTLAEFWAAALNNEDVTDCAVNAGILTELERYKDYDVSRVDGYARSIKRFAYLADVRKKAESLRYQAEQANDAGIEKAVNEIIKIPSTVANHIVSIGDTADEVEREIIERAKNPVDVWGIHYAWPKISKLTGGKQKGELILHSAEPKIGKSWFWLQDALYTAMGDSKLGIPETPVYYWCGEMKRAQLMRRFYQILGVNGRAMKSGRMSEEDWGLLADAKALVMNSPLHIDDKPLMLHELRSRLVREKAEHGIEQFVIDYAMKIIAPGKDETEQTANISREIKNICNDLSLAGVLITSVNKGGMDSKTEFASKSNVRGSGQQIHDADVIYIMTKFNGQRDGQDYGVMPHDYDRVVSVHISAGRELDQQIEGGFIPYMRKLNSPKFVELQRKP